MIARRKLFSFLAVSPVAAVAAVAHAKQPTEIDCERITLGKFEIKNNGDRLSIRQIDGRCGLEIMLMEKANV